MNWIRWNNGMHPATLITDMNFIDSSWINGKFYIIAGTFGRSVYLREISGDDPLNISSNVSGLPDSYSIDPNFPNPFNSTTIISFNLPLESFVTIKVYNLLGQEIKTIINEKVLAGKHKVNFEANALLASGIYFYTMKINSIDNETFFTKRMMFLK